MENMCIRCGIAFDSDSLETGLCPVCESELNLLDKGEGLELEYDDAEAWDSDDY
jgi:hypothetical protein